MLVEVIRYEQYQAVILYALTALDSIFFSKHTYDDVSHPNKFVSEFLQLGGRDSLERSVNHPSYNVWKKSNVMLDTYFRRDHAEEDLQLLDEGHSETVGFMFVGDSETRESTGGGVIE